MALGNGAGELVQADAVIADVLLDAGRRADRDQLWLGAWLLARTIARSPYTRHDAPLSARRAYTRDEMADLIREAGATPTVSFAGFALHRYAIAAS